MTWFYNGFWETPVLLRATEKHNETENAIRLTYQRLNLINNNDKNTFLVIIKYQTASLKIVNM